MAELSSVIHRRVSVSQVDHRQIFFATHLLWMEEGYEELLHLLGHPVEGHEADGIGTPIVSVSCDYLKPLALGDKIRLHSAIDSYGQTSFRVAHEIRHRDVTVTRGLITHVCIDSSSRPIPVPAWVREASSSRWRDVSPARA